MTTEKKKNERIWIATGGTAGHIFPALAVADALKDRGIALTISSDVRGMKYIKEYAEKNCSSSDIRCSFVWASGVGAKNPLFQIWSLFKILTTAIALSIRFIFSRPAKIVAFGGYSSVPVLAAGWIWGIPTFLHEQNAAIGRANKFALPFVKTLMTSFPIGVGTWTGLPVRKEIREAARHEFLSFPRRREPNRESRLLVMGGSLGASILDETVPAAVIGLKRKLFVVHQTRPENVDRVRKIYTQSGVKNNVLSFIKDMGTELAAADLVVARGGASTVAEMQTIGVPAVLVPLGINPDQLANAKAFAANGGGIVIKQRDFDVKTLSNILKALLWNPERLAEMSRAARVENDAVARIVDTILHC